MIQRKSMFSLDVLALALLTCLLASVVGMLILGDGANMASQRRALGEKIQEIADGVLEIRDAQQEISQRFDNHQEQRVAQIEFAEFARLEREIKVREKLNDVEAEIARLRDEQDDLSKRERERESAPGRRQIVGDYRGSYVLIECLKGYALVYPGKTKLAKKPDPKTLKELLDRITQAGFVVFVVRPAGWTKDAFDSIQELVFAELNKFEQTSGKKIGRSAFPLEAKESIKPYLPPDPAATTQNTSATPTPSVPPTNSQKKIRP